MKLKRSNGKEPTSETFLWNQKGAPDVVRDKCVTPLLETAKVKIPMPERVCCGNVIIKPSQDGNLTQEMKQTSTRVSQVSLIRQPDPEEQTEEKGKQSGGKWNSYAVYSEGKQQSYEEQVGKMSEAEVKQMEELLAQRKKKSEANDDVCIKGKACQSGEWQQSQDKQTKYAQYSENENNGWQNWSDSDWSQARNLQQAHDKRREQENEAKEQTNESSESSTGRKRSGEKVPVAPATSTVWGRKKFLSEARD